MTNGYDPAQWLRAALNWGAAGPTLIMHHFAYRNGVMHAEAVDLVPLAEAVGTPFYCYSTATLARLLKHPRPTRSRSR